MLNRPHALYYNGELIGIITNPDPFGSADEISDALNSDGGDAKVVPIPNDLGTLKHWKLLFKSLESLKVPEVLEPPKPPDGDS